MSAEFAYDVFLSYSQADARWVRGELLKRLERAGLKVCIDYRDFVAGAPKLTEPERAIINSRKTVLVLTPAYLADGWDEFETLLLQTLDPASRQRRLIPLRKEPCDLPLRLAMITPVDFADPDSAPFVWKQLLTALGAPPEPEEVAQPSAANWHLAHPYPMQPNFTGRMSERRLLSEWLGNPHHPLLVLRALGGFGKSALTWQWLTHDIDPRTWPRLVFWSFYEGDASFERFLRATLDYLEESQAEGLGTSRPLSGSTLGAKGKTTPPALSPREQVEALLHHLTRPGTLLILDGFERQLRAFSGMNAAYQGDETLTPPQPSPAWGGSRDLGGKETVPPPSGGRGPTGRGGGPSDLDCISPLAEHFLRGVASLPALRSNVLMTTRLRPRVLERHNALLQGCRELELRQLHPDDAVTFFQGLGIRGSQGELRAAGTPYGYHPLSLRLLAGLVQNDFTQPGDIAAAQRLNVHNDLVQQQHHVLEHAYDSLPPARQQLLSYIACYRFGVDYKALQSLAAETENPNLDTDLRDLLARGLVQRDGQTNRFDLHPIVRHYAYDRLALPARQNAHRVLIIYFEAVPAVERPRTLDDLQPVIELYHHLVRAGQYDAAFTLIRDRLTSPLYFQFGSYRLYAELLHNLFPNGEDHLPRLEDQSEQGWILNSLASAYSLSGQPRRAMSLFEQNNTIQEKLDDKRNLAIGLGNLAAYSQLPIGALRSAAANLQRCIDLCEEIENGYQESIGHAEFGRLLAYGGVWAEAEEELAKALFEKQKDVHWQGVVWAYRALLGLLMGRASSPPPNLPLLEGGTVSLNTSSLLSPQAGEGWVGVLSAARRALELADEDARTDSPVERDYVQAHWLLGAAHRVNHDLAAADRHLTEALTRCRAINMVDHEANILLDLARLRWDQANATLRAQRAPAQGAQVALQTEALELAQEALLITERSGYVLQGADVRLFLAQVAYAAGDLALAREHATLARDLAYCDGPPYSYHVAYDEALAWLAQLAGPTA